MASALTDQAFWPPQEAILDLTLAFEDVILKILVSGIFVAISPLVARHFLGNPLFVRSSPLLWTKLVRPWPLCNAHLPTNETFRL